MDTTKKNSPLDDELAELRRARDELRVQAHLGKAEAKALWQRVEQKWPDVEARVAELENASADAARKIGDAASDLLKEIKDAYKKLKEDDA